MGDIRVKVKLENNGDLFLREIGKLDGRNIRVEEVDALVDTGAVMVLLLQSRHWGLIRGRSIYRVKHRRDVYH